MSSLNPYVMVVLVDGTGTPLPEQLKTPEHALLNGPYFSIMWDHLRAELMEDHGYRLPPSKRRVLREYDNKENA